MKRSEINNILKKAKAFLKDSNFYLPSFAYWKPDVWKTKAEDISEIIECGLGWDITDFGSNRFDEIGLFLFTLRNGMPENLKNHSGKLYAEKIMIAEVNQVTPMHFHWNKMEDIINRGGGKLIIELHNSSEEKTLDNTEVQVVLDGVLHKYKAGTRVSLCPGESITLTPNLYHSFWAEEERVLIGEVSLVNDDNLDNCFLNPVGRFPAIKEDEAPLHLLIGDYEQYYA